ncbi:hypothetical protein F5884DRAFT_753610 [Xylogone sp. PMI_703]|nr:hypothetical protein F5884DRAFT_753610 [Xylogone sp. PMI_703]
MSSAAEKANLARIRDNQRRSRARRKEYLQELEARLRQCELEGIEASAEIQVAARKVADENKKLRRLLAQNGIGEDMIESFLQQSSLGDAATGNQYVGTGAAVQNLEHLLQSRKPCCPEWGTGTPTQAYTACAPRSQASSSSVSTARSIWKPIPSQPINTPRHQASTATLGRAIEHQFMTPSSTASDGSSISSVYAAGPVAYHQQLGSDLIPRDMSPVSSHSRESSQIYEYANNIPISHTRSFDNSHSHLQQLQISASHPPDSYAAVPSAASNVNSCIFAADMITTMTGSDPQSVRADLGCGQNGDCQVDNQLVFNVMDRYTDPNMGV